MYKPQRVINPKRRVVQKKFETDIVPKSDFVSLVAHQLNGSTISTSLENCSITEHDLITSESFSKTITPICNLNVIEISAHNDGHILDSRVYILPQDLFYLIQLVNNYYVSDRSFQLTDLDLDKRTFIDFPLKSKLPDPKTIPEIKQWKIGDEMDPSISNFKRVSLYSAEYILNSCLFCDRFSLNGLCDCFNKQETGKTTIKKYIIKPQECSCDYWNEKIERIRIFNDIRYDIEVKLVKDYLTNQKTGTSFILSDFHNLLPAPISQNAMEDAINDLIQSKHFSGEICPSSKLTLTTGIGKITRTEVSI